MKYPAYPQYKDSGVAWLGEVPEHWEVRRLKYLASINDSALPESTDADFEFSYIDIGSVNLVDGITATESMIFENAPSRARRVVQAGDIIVSTVRTYLRAIASIPQSEETLIVSTGFGVVRPRRIESNFLNYALKEASFVENVVSRSVGVSYPAVNASEIGDIKIPAPSETEQTAIADFLDSETGRIDTLVAKKRKLVALLKEKRSALISRTVTRGLPVDAAREFGLTTGNSAVHEAPGAYGRCRGEKFFAPTDGAGTPEKFKDSGVEWLGEIPAHWNIAKFSREVYIAEGQVSPEKEPYSKMILIGPEHIESGTGRLLKEETAEDQSAISGKYYCLHGDVVYSKIRPALRKLVVINYDCLCSADMYPLRGSDKLSNRYIFWLFLSEQFSNWSVLEADRVAMPKINRDTLSELRLPVPSIEEQTAIAAYLDRETAKIDRLVAKVETAIARLQEYRSALITAAVTGKIDVREA